MKNQRLWGGIGAAAMLAGAAFVALFDPSNGRVFPFCPLYVTTSIACPGCGLTRAFHAFLHGDILKALDFNILFPFVGLALAFVFLSWTLLAIRGRGLSYPALGAKTIWTTFSVVMLFAVLRNLPVYPFTVLYP